jgi:apolipoprotein D and lipocalin family protein
MSFARPTLRPALQSAQGTLQRIQRSWLQTWLLLLGAGLLSACTMIGPPPGVSGVSPFDLQRYQGRWFELARLDHSFERGLSDVSAAYSTQADGSVRVVNRGFHAESGQWREAIGKALFVGEPTTGSLKVSFFGPFYGGYHVAALDPNYQWALVIGPDLGYCWILVRDPQLDASQRAAITAKAKALGIDTAALIWVTHTRKDPTH